METYTLTRDELKDMMETVSQEAALKTAKMLGHSTDVSLTRAGLLFGRKKIERLIRERKIKSTIKGNTTQISIDEIVKFLKAK